METLVQSEEKSEINQLSILTIAYPVQFTFTFNFLYFVDSLKI